MLYVILLLILAVLLFGSSAVLGVLGIVLGFIAAFIALTMLGVLYSLTPSYLILIGIAGLAVLVGGFFLFAWIIQPYEIAKMNAQMRREWEAELPSNLTPAERKERIAEIHRLFPMPAKRSLMRR